MLPLPSAALRGSDMISRSSPLENLIAFRRDPLGLFARLIQESGSDVALLSLDIGGAHPLFLVNDPAIVREVLVTRESEFEKWFDGTLSAEVLGMGLVVSEGEPYRQMRRMVQPAFHGRHLPRHAAHTVAIADLECERWPATEAFDLEIALYRLTTRVTAQLLFGVDLAATGDLDRIGAAWPTILAAGQRFALPMGERAEYEAALAEFHGTLTGIVTRRREARAAAPAGITTEPLDLLDLLLDASWDDGQPLDDAELRDQMMSVFLAGQNTTATALLWMFYLVATHPAVEVKIRAEVEAVLGSPGQRRSAAFDDVPQLIYTRQVWQETLRLYPPIWTLARRTRSELVLAGETLPAGAMLLVSPYFLQRDEHFWPEPESFRPERWDPVEAGLIPARPRFSYFPFAGGSRHCPGESLAEMESVLLLATIMQRWRITLAPQPPVEQQVIAFLLRPKRGLLVSAERR